jgi:hypothetical protein
MWETSMSDKDFYTCQAFVRGKAKPGCHRQIKAEAYDYKTLKAAGWQHNGNHRRDHWKCPACKPHTARGKKVAKKKKKKKKAVRVKRKMARFVAIITQANDGCDHSIGCGTKVVDIKADTINDAWKKLIRDRWADYDPRLGGECDPHSAVKGCDYRPIEGVRMLHVITEDDSGYFDAWYDSACAAYDRAQEDEDTAAELAEYERLKAKFGD